MVSMERTQTLEVERASARTVEAVLFDMDGLLIDSEPFWREAEIAAFGEVGVVLTDDMCRRTTGLRVDDVVEYWHRERPWDGVAKTDVERRIVDEGIRLIRLRGASMPGVARGG